MKNQLMSFCPSSRKTAGYVAVTSLMMLAVFSQPGNAQLQMDVRAPAVVFYDAQTKSYHPGRVVVSLWLKNRSSDTIHHIRGDLYCQRRLSFDSRERTLSLNPAESIPPDDSLLLTLELSIVDWDPRLEGQFRYPQQLFWRLQWEQGRSNGSHESEGHAVAVVDGDCPGGMTPGLKQQLVLRDTVTLLPGEDGREVTVVEVDGLIHSLDGREHVIRDVHLTIVRNYNIFDEAVTAERILPTEPMTEVTVSGTDTLYTRYRIRIPYGMADDHLFLVQVANVFTDSACYPSVVSVNGTNQALWFRHEPGKRLRIAGGIHINHHGGNYGSLKVNGWCGTEPEGMDSTDVTVRENGQSIPLERFDPQLYRPDRHPVHGVFCIDVSHSMNDPETRGRILEIVQAWQRMMDPARDSMTVFTLSDSARMILAPDEQAGSLDSLLTSTPVSSNTGLSPLLRNVVAYAREKQNPAAVRVLLMTDGWFPREEMFLDSLLAEMRDTGLHFSLYTPSVSINHDALPAQYTVASVPLDFAETQRTWWEIHEAGLIYYPIPCWSGRNRHREITVRDWCGGDTVLQHTYELGPYLEPVPLRIEMVDTAVAGGQKLDYSIHYTHADELFNDHAEFLIEYDTTVLALQSVTIPELPHTELHWTWETPGRIHAITGVDADGGAGELGTLSFSTPTVADTVRTHVVITAWDRGNCIPADSSHIAMVTLLPPATTGMETAPNASLLHIDALYPQPAANVLHVDMQASSGQSCVLRVIDMLGRTRQRVIVAGEEIDRGSHVTMALDPDLPSGVYVLELQQEGQHTLKTFQVLQQM